MSKHACASHPVFNYINPSQPLHSLPHSCTKVFSKLEIGKPRLRWGIPNKVQFYAISDGEKLEKLMISNQHSSTLETTPQILGYPIFRQTQISLSAKENSKVFASINSDDSDIPESSRKRSNFPGSLSHSIPGSPSSSPHSSVPSTWTQ